MLNWVTNRQFRLRTYIWFFFVNFYIGLSFFRFLLSPSSYSSYTLCFFFCCPCFFYIPQQRFFFYITFSFCFCLFLSSCLHQQDQSYKVLYTVKLLASNNSWTILNSQTVKISVTIAVQNISSCPRQQFWHDLEGEQMCFRPITAVFPYLRTLGLLSLSTLSLFREGKWWWGRWEKMEEDDWRREWMYIQNGWKRSTYLFIYLSINATLRYQILKMYRISWLI